MSFFDRLWTAPFALGFLLSRERQLDQYVSSSLTDDNLRKQLEAWR